jgi:hypothetical protein
MSLLMEMRRWALRSLVMLDRGGALLALPASALLRPVGSPSSGEPGPGISTAVEAQPVEDSADGSGGSSSAAPCYRAVRLGRSGSWVPFGSRLSGACDPEVSTLLRSSWMRAGGPGLPMEPRFARSAEQLEEVGVPRRRAG